MRPAPLALPLVLCLAGLAAAAERPLRQVIDAEVRAAWEREKVTPTPRAGDAEFLRRVHLDLVGTIPTGEEVQQFLKDADPQKREKLIDRLLGDPRYATQRANVWDQVLFGRNPGNIDATRVRPGFRAWLTDQFARNEPYDHWVRGLLLANQDGPDLFYVQYRSQTEEMTVAVSRIFLGTQLQCARCHDHPYEPWTQKDFYGMAAFLARVVVLDAGTGTPGMRKYTVGEKSTGDVLFTGPAKDQKPGQKGEPIKPKYLGGDALVEPELPKDFKEVDTRTAKSLPKPVFSRKEKLADWITAPDNPYFARAVANRVWAEFLGRGLVHPVDDLSDKNTPSHPALLEEMARQLVARKFDLKWLIRELVNSDTYQLSGAGPGTDALPRWYERARVRPLSAEEISAALRTASGFDRANQAAGVKPGQDRYPLEGEYVVRYFGSPTNGLGDFQPGLGEHLFMNNASQVRQLIQPRAGNLADEVLKSTAPWEERVERLFLSTLGRPPRPEERSRFATFLTADPKKPDAALVDAIWVLLSCSEFRFNH